GACEQLGVELLPNTSVHGFRRAGETVEAVQTERAELSARRFLIAGGAWTDQLVAPLGLRLGIYPVRGQIVLFNPGRVMFAMVMLAGKNYLVPRTDGRVLAGSTEEDVGFVKQTTASALAELSRLARRLVPALTEAMIETSWAGLRPATRDELPFLGCVPGM